MGDEIRDLEVYVRGLLKDRDSMTLLEAGCGSMSHVGIENVTKVVGIDLSRNRLERNRRIDERIVGDLQTYRLPEGSFDVILCWNVLEHVPNPRLVIDSFFRALKSHGVIILAFPNLMSFKGLVTKFTPYAFHRAFYRYVMGDKREDDFEQFPTYLRRFIRPLRLRNFAESHGFSVSYFRLYEGPVQRDWTNKSLVARVVFQGVGSISRALSRGRLDLNLTDCIMVLERKPGATR